VQTNLPGRRQKAFLKTDSIGKILVLDLPFDRYQPQDPHQAGD
jgi:hypothetical protein